MKSTDKIKTCLHNDPSRYICGLASLHFFGGVLFVSGASGCLPDTCAAVSSIIFQDPESEVQRYDLVQKKLNH